MKIKGYNRIRKLDKRRHAMKVDGAQVKRVQMALIDRQWREARLASA